MKIKHDPKAQQINFLDERFYTLDGETYFPSVTTVLGVYPKGHGFDDWLKELGFNAEIVLKKAGEQGTNVHRIIDNLLKGEHISWTNEKGTPAYTMDEWMMALRFERFWKTYKPTLIANETTLLSTELGFGGTIDTVCQIEGKTWLVDYKTSNAIHKTYEMQLAAYAMMWNEHHPDQKIEKTGILWLKSSTRGPDKKGKVMQGSGWILKEFDRPYEDSFELFKHVYAIWKEENPNYIPKNKSYPDFIQL